MPNEQAEFRTTAGVIAATICKDRNEALIMCYEQTIPAAYEDRELSGYRVLVPHAEPSHTGQQLNDYSASRIHIRHISAAHGH